MDLSATIRDLRVQRDKLDEAMTRLDVHGSR
jgi:hypothetical protein